MTNFRVDFEIWVVANFKLDFLKSALLKNALYLKSSTIKSRFGHGKLPQISIS